MTVTRENKFDESTLVNKAIDMYGMIDIEQMYRTVKAMRELNMSAFPAAPSVSDEVEPKGEV